MRQLVFYQGYTRREIHDLFDPDSMWGLQGGAWVSSPMVALPHRPGDFVFLLTLDRQRESDRVTTEGVLVWGPDASTSGQMIEDLARHDDTHNIIHLFLRTDSRARFTYLGPLRYLSRARQAQGPPLMFWQILTWPLPRQTHLHLGLALSPHPDPARRPRSMLKSQLKVTPPPPPRVAGGTPSAPTAPGDLPEGYVGDEGDDELVHAGELIVIAHEQRLLVAEGRADLAHRVRHVSAIEGRTAPFNIESFTPQGVKRFIQVRTTRGPIDTPFTLTRRELAFARAHAGACCLYRVYHFLMEHNTGKLFIATGPLEESLCLTPVLFRLEP